MQERVTRIRSTLVIKGLTSDALTATRADGLLLAMFRKPRDTTTVADVGRPPSPGAGPAKTPFTLSITPTVPIPTKMAVAKTRTPAKVVPLPTIGRQGFVGNGKKPASAAKLKEKGNGNIMSFFKKEEQTLFFGDAVSSTAEQQDEEEHERFNEIESPQKRRRLSEQREEIAAPLVEVSVRKPIASGPFMEDSDDEEELNDADAQHDSVTDVVVKEEPREEALPTESPAREATPSTNGKTPVRPTLLKQETSYDPTMEGFDDFDNLEGDFEEDIYEDGDEFLERRYLEEQAQLEDDEIGEAACCPICNASLGGVPENEAAIHVNNCLDGKPTPLKRESMPVVKVESKEESKAEGSLHPKQFKWPPRPAKPGQANPFTLDEPTGGSAFNKLMSGHAEDSAWAEAAAHEHASRGKPSWQRTCPFYKILPGFFIAVDAFRYGAVKGISGTFLSHFHSDHYGGLTSTWTYGPIYCSRVTGNLVRQQLKVDPKFVIDLEFEQKVEVPGTKGVFVTMISANHCPGSSLFLFEKVIGKKSNGQPRLQRVLHCGDFRACRAHIQHPLLMPDVRDKITGAMTEQKIDVCYLDTTYLNPKYAFPSQETVIKACADMCVSLSRVTVDETDGWEQMKRQRAGEGMVKFVRRESSDIKEETNNDMKLEAAPLTQQTKLSSSASQTRGRLLVVCGTYSIGKERIALGIAKALNSKIYAPSQKQRIVAALEDPELDERMTTDPREAQVHLLMLFEIRAETVDDYLKDYYPHFRRAVAFRPSGWTYKPPNSRVSDPTVSTVLHSDNWKSTFSMRDLVPQRGSTSRASCFGVPYSEHSSFRELTMFCTALRIDKIIPTVNINSDISRKKMKVWIERWQNEKKKNGLYQLPEDGSW